MADVWVVWERTRWSAAGVCAALGPVAIALGSVAALIPLVLRAMLIVVGSPRVWVDAVIWRARLARR